MEWDEAKYISDSDAIFFPIDPEIIIVVNLLWQYPPSIQLFAKDEKKQHQMFGVKTKLNSKENWFVQSIRNGSGVGPFISTFIYAKYDNKLKSIFHMINYLVIKKKRNERSFLMPFSERSFKCFRRWCTKDNFQNLFIAKCMKIWLANDKSVMVWKNSVNCA